MIPLQPIDPRAQADHDGDQVVQAQRQRALDLCRVGAPLKASELALVMRKGIGQFHKLAKRGTYDDFLIPGALGPARYSGVKVQRYLNGEVVDTTLRTSFRRGQ
jgi:hypothetical protein